MSSTEFSKSGIRWIDYRLRSSPSCTANCTNTDAKEFELSLEFWIACGHRAGDHDRDRIVLAMHYVPTFGGAFNSVEHIMRDVNYGWLIRYLHTSGASMFFAVVYIHIFRGLYYGSYKAPRELLWILGVVILLLMMRPHSLATPCPGAR